MQHDWSLTNTNTPAHSLTPGGSATNVARAVAALSPPTVDVTFIGAAGTDGTAAHYAAGLAAARVLASLLAGPPGQPTGTCLALVTPDGQRTMRTSLGAASGLQTAASLPTGWAEDVACVHLEGYTLWRPGLATGLLRAARAASPHALTSIDCASVECVASRGGELAAALASGCVDILFCNEDEAAALAAHVGVAGGNEAADVVGAVLSAAVSSGARVAVASLGAAGARCAHRDSASASPAHCRVPALPVPSIADTVGTGDAFAGGVLAALLSGAPPAAALSAGCAAGAAAVAAHGADPGEEAWGRVRERVGGVGG